MMRKKISIFLLFFAFYLLLFSNMSFGWTVSGAYEPAMGNPGVDGYCSKSTIAGVRSWGDCGGVGDIESVGDCVSGAALDGSSDGGTYIRLFDGGTHYIELDAQPVTANRQIVLPATAGTLALTSQIPTTGTIAPYNVGILTNTYLCTYATASGFVCNTNPASFDTGTLGQLTAGTMSDGKGCIYTASGTQVVCNSTFLTAETNGGLTLSPQTTGFTITGGTTSKTLTVSGDATISATPYVPAGTDVALADGGTGASLSDPNANTILGWDDTDNAVAFFTLGTGLSYAHSTHTLSASGGGGLANIVEDTTPQLGGSLDVNGQSIVSASNGNIVIAPNGSGKIIFTGSLGANSIVNGTFDTDTGWEKGQGWTISGGKAVATDATEAFFEFSSTVVMGKYYKLVFDATVADGSFYVRGGNWSSQVFDVTASSITRYFYSSGQDSLAFIEDTVFTGTIDNVVLTEVQTSFNLDNVSLTTSNSTLPLVIIKKLNDATGNQVAVELNYEVDKAGGSDTGLIINRGYSATAGPSYLLDFRNNGSSVFSIDSNGGFSSVTSNGIIYGFENIEAVGDINAGGFLQSGGYLITVADETRATTTLSGLENLSNTLPTLLPSKGYVGRMTIKCNNTVAAEGIKFDFNGGSATAYNFWAAAHQDVGGTVIVGTSIVTSLAGVLNFTTITGETLINIDFSLITLAGGTFVPRFAANSHSTGTATVELGSFMIINSMP